MSILEALEEVAAGLPAMKTVHYATLEESNATIADTLLTSEYPFLLIFPFSPVDLPGMGAAIETSVNLEMLLLDKETTQRTVDFRTSDIEISIVAPMRLLGRRFMHQLSSHSIIDKSKTNAVGATTYDPTYSSHDAALHGVLIKTSLKVLEKANVCY